MDNELEKQFFNTFGIEAKYKCTRDDNYYFPECIKCGWYIRTYPQITDRILLELICIHNNYLRTHLYSVDYESLVKEVLKDLINEQKKKEFKTYHVVDDMKREVQALFKEG